jgi:hypothetical protein
VETTFDTDDDRSYGYGKNVLAPVAFTSFDAPRLRCTFFPGLRHHQSALGDPVRRNVNYAVARFFILSRQPGNFYTGIENALHVDHERNGRTGVGLHGDLLPWLYNWSFEAGVRCLFD